MSGSGILVFAIGIGYVLQEFLVPVNFFSVASSISQMNVYSNSVFSLFYDISHSNKEIST